MSFEYRAFMSYSHQDEVLARKLFSALERFKVPSAIVGMPGRDGPVPERLIPLFRDEDELPASADLGNQLTDALQKSAVLVVLCSPAAAASRWVNEEILAFKRMGRENRILAVILSGEPNASESEGREALECFPHALRHRMREGALTGERVEPIAADLRRGPRVFRDVILRVAAGIMGIAYDDLKQRHATAERKANVLRLAATGGATAVLALGIGFGLFKENRVVERVVDTAGPAFDGAVILDGYSPTLGYDLRADVTNGGSALATTGAAGLFAAHDATVKLLAYRSNIDPVDRFELKFGFKGVRPSRDTLPRYLLVCVWPDSGANRPGLPVYFERNDAVQYESDKRILMSWVRVVSVAGSSPLGGADRCSGLRKDTKGISGSEASFPDAFLSGSLALAFGDAKSKGVSALGEVRVSGAQSLDAWSTSHGSWFQCERDRSFSLPKCRLNASSSIVSGIRRLRVGTSADHLDQSIANDNGAVSGGLVAVTSSSSLASQALRGTYLVLSPQDKIYAQAEFADGAMSQIVESPVEEPSYGSPEPLPTLVRAKDSNGPPLVVRVDTSASRWHGGRFTFAPLVGADVTGASWSLFEGGYTPLKRSMGLFSLSQTGSQLGFADADALPDHPLELFYVFTTEQGETRQRYEVDLAGAAVRQARDGADLTEMFSCRKAMRQTNTALSVEAPQYVTATCVLHTPVPSAALLEKIYWGTGPDALKTLDPADFEQEANRWAEDQIRSFAGPDKERRSFEAYVRRQASYGTVDDWRVESTSRKVIAVTGGATAVFVKVRFVDGGTSDVMRIPIP